MCGAGKLYLNFRSRREFIETLRDEKAIAPAAATGFRNPFSPMIGLSNAGTCESANMGYSAPAATGIRSMLYINAHTRFCRIILDVVFPSFMMCGIVLGWLFVSVISAACMAMSVPLAIAMPTFAVASAGPSLMPSPAIAVFLPLWLSCWIWCVFCVGNSSAEKCVTPNFSATA